MFSWLAIGSLTHKNFKGKRFNWKSGLTFISSGSNTEIFFAHSRLIIYAWVPSACPSNSEGVTCNFLIGRMGPRWITSHEMPSTSSSTAVIFDLKLSTRRTSSSKIRACLYPCSTMSLHTRTWLLTQPYSDDERESPFGVSIRPSVAWKNSTSSPSRSNSLETVSLLSVRLSRLIQ